MKFGPKLIVELTKKVLSNPYAYQNAWTLQGFGMLRLYMEDGLRLSIWSKRHRSENVSLVHSHPWNFRSYVVAGEMHNTIFGEAEPNFDTMPFIKQTIRAGEGGGLEGEPSTVHLKSLEYQVVRPGEVYGQDYDEIHYSDPVDGTITLCDRAVPIGNSKDHAYVYWNAGNVWGTAEPRPATLREIDEIVEMGRLQLAHVSVPF